MKEVVRKLVTKHWDSNWHDSRTIEGEVEWIMKFAHEIVKEWLKKFSIQVEKSFKEGI